MHCPPSQSVPSGASSAAQRSSTHRPRMHGSPVSHSSSSPLHTLPTPQMLSTQFKSCSQQTPLQHVLPSPQLVSSGACSSEHTPPRPQRPTRHGLSVEHSSSRVHGGAQLPP